ncbi:hypothetical protein CIT31_30800 [Mesorhizobium wenxiniae]|uniref:Uncharacterized protein n=1 Tax=Mesorhizobium wenxiniae TaxID=2014805 RepID=A0A271K7L7_9HYPH|nr:hypothetical protein CIT31_30800 [Mesorhizobium wenxiniae]
MDWRGRRYQAKSPNGAASVAVSALGITGLFLVLCIVAVLADRGVSRMRSHGNYQGTKRRPKTASS